MENVILTVHLLLALALIVAVLLQRSEGGGLGIGGGAGVVSGRAAATAMSKVTWGLAIAFICTSLALTVVARQEASSGSVIGGVTSETPSGADLLPPSLGDQPLTPPRVD